MEIQSSKILVLCLVMFCLSVEIEGQLQNDFYCNTCPSAERIIMEEVRKAFMNDKGIAPGLVRMHFHDCFVRVSYNIF